MKSENEKNSEKMIEDLFIISPNTTIDKLKNFCKYVPKQNITKLLSMYEIYKQILNIEGCIVECGVFQGGSLMGWAKLSSILEPTNWKRKVYGFDTFDGFPSVSDKDQGDSPISIGQLNSNSYDELLEIIKIYNMDRYIGHIEKVNIIEGNAIETIPKFIEDNKHIMISLLYLDFDLYEPTKVALENFVTRMTKGSVIVFDNVNHPNWPGETIALFDYFDNSKIKINRNSWDSTLCYLVLGE